MRKNKKMMRFAKFLQIINFHHLILFLLDLDIPNKHIDYCLRIITKVTKMFNPLSASNVNSRHDAD